ncbi:hypothetical protein AS594_31245 [Streptomyces agglomeratus]|uniref:Uncharacterized protein n=1 Tax=Streptomyces agglomeratus TaxID=285458 RepID=A0A1E5PFM6_9ACTN|nr:hypothetical protein AS594_31245 [Streptomyces agglomeratus]OEJ50179.1 hypothetical protein BGK72_04810 [Streptomyces agglomeratus]
MRHGTAGRAGRAATGAARPTATAYRLPGERRAAPALLHPGLPVADVVYRPLDTAPPHRTRGAG